MRIHYLQHVPFENPGSILEWANKNQCLVTATHLYDNEKLPQLSEFDWLVVMGGPMNIYEEDQYPWLKVEKGIDQSGHCSKKNCDWDVSGQSVDCRRHWRKSGSKQTKGNWLVPHFLF